MIDNIHIQVFCRIWRKQSFLADRYETTPTKEGIMREKTTVAVIGGGPGGYVAAIRAAQLGADVTLIEKEHLGGTCLNVGCIPTKALLHGAELYNEARNASEWGIHAEIRLDFAEMQRRKTNVVKKLSGGVQALLRSNNVRIIMGTARFLDSKSLFISEKDATRTLTFDKIIIASGSVPSIPPIPGIDCPHCIDSTGALRLEAVPSSLIIIGGGVIGVEMATLYNMLGSHVHIVEMANEILPMMDGELVGMLRADFARKGVRIHTRSRVARIEDRGSQAAVHMESDSGTHILIGDNVLFCVGRKANTEALGLEACGIAAERGQILVNAHMETRRNGVYAVGDCTGQMLLAHVASMQGEIAAENALGHSAEFRAATNPSCVYSCPELACAGLTEEAARRTGKAYDAGVFPLAANGRALIMNGGNGMFKVLVGKKHREILGVHMYGPRATDLISEACLALGMEATSDEVLMTIHGHPTLSEALREAVLAAEGRAVHLPSAKGRP